MTEQKNIVITGSSRGFGFALAEEFLKAGCRVMLSGASIANLERAVMKLGAFAGLVFSRLCDVTDVSQVEALWREAEQRLGPVDIWINNAGLGQDWLPAWEVSPEAARAIVETNITGLLNGFRTAFRGMRARGKGRIYNLEGFGSDGRHMNNLTVYGATKCAVRYLSVGLSREAKGSGVLVGTISPGMMATDFVLRPLRRDPERYKKSRRILNLIADRPATVARAMAPRLLANQRQGARFVWLTGGRLLGRFLFAPFAKRDVFPETAE